MKIVLLYLRILKKFDLSFPEQKSYAQSSKRFLESYKIFKPSLPHSLIVVNCGSLQHDGLFDGVATDYRNYNGGGYDCGTYQAIGSKLECDLVVALNTHVHFWRSGWLEYFVEARTRFGPGVYGATASYEGYPHLRTPAIAFSPEIMKRYPCTIDTRNEAASFEAGPSNFSLWAHRNHIPCWLVTADGLYGIKQWRTPKNIFRRGTQRNCLIFDRHTDIYENANERERKLLEQTADRTPNWNMLAL